MKAWWIIAIVVLLLLAVYVVLRKKKKYMMNVKDLPFIEKVRENQQEFGENVIDGSNKLGINPRDTMIVMNNESGLNHRAKNPGSSATGLIQFMKDTAIKLGTTTDRLAAMSNVEQLDYVFKYLSRYADKMKDTSDVYLAVFFPAALYQQSEDWQFPAWAVKANPIFDLNKDGKLTKREFRQYVNQKYAKYLK